MNMPGSVGRFLMVSATCLHAVGCTSLASTPSKGVIFTQIEAGTPLSRAGIQPGDVLVSWNRKTSTATSAEGNIKTSFDWIWLKEEQVPRGPVRLEIWKEGVRHRVEVEMGMWTSEVGPRLPPVLKQKYSSADSLVQAGRIEEGVRVFEEVLSALEKKSDRWIICWLWFKIGRSWAQANNLPAAIEAYERALRIAPDAISRGLCWTSMGEAYINANELGKARAALQNGLLSQEASERSLWTAIFLSSIATVALQQGDSETAGRYGEMALHIRQSLAPESFQNLQILNTMGGYYFARGDLYPAENLFRRALQVQQKIFPNRLVSAGLFSNLGLVAWAQNDLRKAEYYLKQSLAIREELAPFSEDMGDILNNLGLIASADDQLQVAEEYHVRALEIQEKISPDSLKVAGILNNLGDIAAARREEEKARRFHERALEIRTRLAPNSVPVAQSLLCLGDMYNEEVGKLGESEKYLADALQLFEKLAPDSSELARTLYEIGLVQRDRGELDLATQSFERAIEVLERQTERQEYAEELSSATLRERHWRLYRDAIEVLLLQSEGKGAFNILERSKARSLSHLLASRNLPQSAEVPKDLEIRRKELAAEHERMRHQMALLNAPEDRDTLVRLNYQLEQVSFQYQEVISQIREVAPRAAGLRYPESLDLEHVQKSLDAGTLLVSFSVGNARSDVFAVTAQGLLRVVRIPVGWKQLARQIDEFKNLISHPPRYSSDLQRGADIQDMAGKLYDVLLGPIDDLLSESVRILIIPDVTLHALPWGALVRTAGEAGEKRYLAEWRPLHIALSGSLYVEARKNSRPISSSSSLTLALFGDPVYPADTSHIEARSSLENVHVVAAVERGVRFSPLPATRSEVERIAALFPEGARVFLGSDATEENAKNLPRNTRIIHFATHAFVDQGLPMDSAIALTIPESLAEDQENGLLQAWEIMENLRIDADLVVLSACESGLGHEIGREGLIGLTRAFQYAGARSVLASLWSVDDIYTAKLMVSFYEYLRKGKSKDEALQAAQSEFITKNGDEEVLEPDVSDPYYWAAFQLSGDWK